MKSEFLDVPQGKIAAVVTHLQMFERPEPRKTADIAAELVAHPKPDVDWYRDLYMRVGGQDWMWFGRLGTDDDALRAILDDDANHIYSVRLDGRDVGLMELDFRQTGECELGYFGLTPDMVGTGTGRWLMERALDLAWAEPIGRFHVHTCTLDSPQALQFYVRSGFAAFARQVEIADDPRQNGVLPADSSPQLPLI